MEKEIGKVDNCSQFFSPILSDMKTISKHYILGLCISLFSISLMGQVSWHTDPYPLNENIDALHYIFELQLEDETNVIKGETTIIFRLTAPERQLFLDLASLDSSGGMVVSKVDMAGKDLNFKHKNNRISIDCPSFSGNDTIMEVTVYYSGVPRDGLIISQNKFDQRSFFGDNWPDRARNWLACIDHVSDKATLEFIINAPSHYEVVANGYLYRQYDIEGSRTIHHWKSDVALPTKVMVMGAAEFAVEMAGYADGTPIQTWVYPENMEEGFFDYAPAVGVVEFYNELLGPFAFEKLANVQSKTVYGGMENSGCIFYYENSVTGKGKVESLLAHEIAHQWFGDAVTEKDWHHIWLSEGFATYLTSVYMDAKHGGLEQSMDRSRSRVVASYHRSPAPLIDTSIVNLRRLLSTNSYQKGAWVLHMLRQELGDEVFWDGMKTYYNDFKNRNALSEDFKNCMEKASRQSLDQFFEQWLRVEGQPELSVDWTWNEKSQTVEIDCRQMQSHCIFDFPLELRLVGHNGENADTLIRISGRDTSFSWPMVEKPDSLVVDPGVKLLFERK